MFVKQCANLWDRLRACLQEGLWFGTYCAKRYYYPGPLEKKKQKIFDLSFFLTPMQKQGNLNYGVGMFLAFFVFFLLSSSVSFAADSDNSSYSSDQEYLRPEVAMARDAPVTTDDLGYRWINFTHLSDLRDKVFAYDKKDKDNCILVFLEYADPSEKFSSDEIESVRSWPDFLVRGLRTFVHRKPEMAYTQAEERLAEKNGTVTFLLRRIKKGHKMYNQYFVVTADYIEELKQSKQMTQEDERVRKNPTPQDNIGYYLRHYKRFDDLKKFVLAYKRASKCRVVFVEDSVMGGLFSQEDMEAIKRWEGYNSSFVVATAKDQQMAMQEAQELVKNGEVSFLLRYAGWADLPYSYYVFTTDAIEAKKKMAKPAQGHFRI